MTSIARCVADALSDGGVFIACFDRREHLASYDFQIIDSGTSILGVFLKRKHVKSLNLRAFAI